MNLPKFIGWMTVLLTVLSGFFPEVIGVEHPVRAYYAFAGVGLVGIGSILEEIREFKENSGEQYG